MVVIGILDYIFLVNSVHSDAFDAGGVFVEVFGGGGDGGVFGGGGDGLVDLLVSFSVCSDHRDGGAGSLIALYALSCIIATLQWCLVLHVQSNFIGHRGISNTKK